MKKMKLLKEKLKDERSGRVIFISHCLLNMNARYFGGAFRRSCVSEVIEEALRRDIAVIQMQCPEQLAWGGIGKPLMWLAFDTKRTPLYLLRGIVLPLFLWYTKLRYRHYAGTLVKEIKDYLKSGYQVLGMIGIDGSPTCGVYKHIDIRCAFRLYSRTRTNDLKRDDFNKCLYSDCLREGRGLFISSVKVKLEKRGIHIPIYSHSLMDEMNHNANVFWEGIV